MPERSSVTQQTQFGLETVSGTGVAANKRFDTFAVILSPKGASRKYRGQGAPVTTAGLVQLIKEWSEAALTGWPSYTGDVYLISSLFGAATITTIGTAGKKWVWAPAGLGSEDTPKTYTVENGSSVRAAKATYGVVTDYGWKWKRDDLTLDGALLLQKYTDGITLTSTPTTVAATPVAPGHLNVYIDTSSGGLGGTQYTRVYSAELAVQGKYQPLWPSGRSNASWPAVVQVEPKATAKIAMQADSNGMGLLTGWRANQVYYVRFEYMGDLLPGEGAQNYLYQWDIACMAEKPNELKDDGGTYAIEWDFQMVYDAAWGTGKYCAVELHNMLASL
jgi:hypothetical protein